MADIFDKITPTATPAASKASQGDIFDHIETQSQQTAAPASQVSSGNVYQAAPDEQTPEGRAAALAKRQAEYPILSAIGQGAGDVLSDFGDAIKSIPSSIVHSLPPVQAYESIKNSIPAFHAYEDARSSGASVSDALSRANDVAKQHDAGHQLIQKAIEAFKKDPGRTSVRALGDAALALSTLYDGGNVNPASLEAPAAEATTATTVAPAAEVAAQPKPSIVKQVLKGADIAQPEAQTALRSGAVAATDEAGISSVQPNSLRTVVEQPIHSLEAESKAGYRAIDEAAGTDFKALNEKLDNTEYQLRQLTDTDEDLAKEAALEKSRTGLIDKIEQAKSDAIKQGVDPAVLDKADSQFLQSRALKDVEARVFKNPSVVKGNAKFGSPETVDVDAAIKALQKLQDNNKFGAPRLEQALGKDGAEGLLNDLYKAQRAGQTALSRQKLAKLIAKIAGAGIVAERGIGLLAK